MRDGHNSAPGTPCPVHCCLFLAARFLMLVSRVLFLLTFFLAFCVRFVAAGVFFVSLPQVLSLFASWQQALPLFRCRMCFCCIVAACGFVCFGHQVGSSSVVCSVTPGTIVASPVYVRECRTGWIGYCSWPPVVRRRPAKPMGSP